MTGTIPIRNLYYLYAYAWDQFRYIHRIKGGEEEGPDGKAFFAKILVQACRHTFRRGVNRDYEPDERELSQLRGRIDLIRTFRKDTLKRGRIWCRFDELTADTVPNQVIKATLLRLLEEKQVSIRLATEIRRCVRTFDELHVKTVELKRETFHRTRIARQTSFYMFLLHICELIYDGLFPKQGGAEGQFASLLDDETRMDRIFERFVRNFLRQEQDEFEVRAERIGWDVGEAPVTDLLPSMQTDASLRSAKRTIIIETKYYSETLHDHHERRTLRSAHLYQLFAYLKNLECRGGPDQFAEGLLLYPTVRDHVQFQTTIQGHRIGARTIDLNQPWQHIHSQLLSLISHGVDVQGVQQHA